MKQGLLKPLLLLQLSACAKEESPTLSRYITDGYSALADDCVRGVNEGYQFGEKITDAWANNQEAIAGAVTGPLRSNGKFSLDVQGAQLAVTRTTDYYHVWISNTQYAYMETFPTASSLENADPHTRTGMSAELIGNLRLLLVEEGGMPARSLDSPDLPFEGQCRVKDGQVTFRRDRTFFGSYRNTELPEIDLMAGTACSNSHCESIDEQSERSLRGSRTAIYRIVLRELFFFPQEFRDLLLQSESDY